MKSIMKTRKMGTRKMGTRRTRRTRRTRTRRTRTRQRRTGRKRGTKGKMEGMSLHDLANMEKEVRLKNGTRLGVFIKEEGRNVHYNPYVPFDKLLPIQEGEADIGESTMIIDRIKVTINPIL